MMKLDDLNNASAADFVALLDGTYEHSPWIAERAAAARPFKTLAALKVALARVVREASIDEQLGLAVGYEWGADKALKSRLASRPAERALIDYLGSLPPDVLFKLRTLMYFGRGDSEDISWLHAHLGSDPTEARTHSSAPALSLRWPPMAMTAPSSPLRARRNR